MNQTAWMLGRVDKTDFRHRKRESIPVSLRLLSPPSDMDRVEEERAILLKVGEVDQETRRLVGVKPFEAL